MQISESITSILGKEEEMIYHDTAAAVFIYQNEQGEQLGKLCYRYIKENTIDAFHTKVNEAYQGQGIAGELYQALMAFDEQEGLSVKPSCMNIVVKMRRSQPHWIA